MTVVAGRGPGIGASEVPVLAGLSPFQTETDVWLDRMGFTHGRDDTGPMAMGRVLERVVLKEGAARMGLTATHNTRPVRHREWPATPLWATPDGWSRGRHELFEVKVVGHHWSDWADGPPPYVALQVQAQICAASRRGRDVRGIVIALLGSDLRTYRIEPDEVAQARIPELVTAWWERHVVGELSPDPANPDDAWALLKARSTPGTVHRLATPDEQAAGNELMVLLAQQDAAKARIEELRVKLAGDAGSYVIDGIGWRGGWSVRTQVDWRAVAGEVGVDADVIARHSADVPAFTFRRQKDGTAQRSGVDVQ